MGARMLSIPGPRRPRIHHLLDVTEQGSTALMNPPSQSSRRVTPVKSGEAAMTSIETTSFQTLPFPIILLDFDRKCVYNEHAFRPQGGFLDQERFVTLSKR